MRRPGVVVSVLLAFLSLCEVARAQPPSASPRSDEGWQVAVYPILVWVPFDIDIAVEVPPSDGGGDDGGAGKIVDGRFDGAYLGGVAATNGAWRVEGYGIWAGFGGDRPDRPFLRADIDLIYGEARVGRRIAPDFYVTGGIRRLALKYDITLGSLPEFSRKPGLWDPLVGIGWHRVRPKFEWHASFEGGGFGVGADVDLGAQVRMDWKPIPHFGLTAGYGIVYLKVSDTVLSREIVVKPTLNGPVAGIGFYF
jgi:hypothetical protein